jgi:phage terminase large subunit-like protein
VRLGCARHLRDLKDGKKRGLHFDAEAAVRAVEFFAHLKHYKGEWAGQPLKLSRWQQFIVGSIMGWKRTDGLRRFREAYEEVARKNGKSTKDAGLVILLAFFDGESAAEVYCAATKKDQARIIFGDAKEMVRRTPALKKRLKIFVNNISSEASSSKIQPLGADEDTMDGLNVHMAEIDEVHAHKTAGIVDVLKTATGSRQQPLVKYVTTAGFDRTSVCWRLHDYAIKVLEGTIQDDTFFAYIATIDEGDDWRNRRVWVKANPNLGVSIHQDDLERKARQAEHIPAALNTFLRLHLNVWTEQAERAVDMDVWDRGSVPVKEEELEGDECTAGLDMASTNDLAAFAKLFGPDADGYYDLLMRFWLPEGSIAAGRTKRSEQLRQQLANWVAEGWITATPGEVIDYDFIEAAIIDDARRFHIREIAYDRWNVTQLVTHLKDEFGEGTGSTQMVEHGQGFRDMSAPTKELLRQLPEGRIRHGGNPVLRWMASNLALKQDPAGNLKPDRVSSGEKIDGIVALIMALGRAIVQPAEPPSQYDALMAERGAAIARGEKPAELIDGW